MTCTSQALAQTATVSGNVVDETGARVPGATVMLTSPQTREMRVTDTAGEYRFTSVPAGSYEIIASTPGFASVKRGGVTVGASGTVTVEPLTLAIAGMGETVVVSASRTESTVLDAPATISVVPASTLQALPSQSYADVLRTVPGMNVVQLSARDINVTSRQATSTLATSQLALLDGRSLYLDFFGLVLWDFVPTSPADIKQIEVVRGPASAVWGANALTGVVNIITKSPREAAGIDVGDDRRRLLQPRFRLDGRRRRRRPVLDEPDDVTGRERSLVVSAQRRLLQLRAVCAAGRARFRSSPTRAIRPARTTVGGGTYPADAEGALGTAFKNQGTSQPKFDARVDQEMRQRHRDVLRRRRGHARNDLHRHRTVRHSAGLRHGATAG